MTGKPTKVEAAFFDSYLDSGALPEQQAVGMYAWLVLKMGNLAMRIANSKTLPFTLTKPVRTQPPVYKPSSLAQECLEFLGQYQPYINQLKDAFAGHTAHPYIQVFWNHLQQNNFLANLSTNYPYQVRDVENFFTSIRTETKSIVFQQEVVEWKERHQAVTKSVRQVLQQRAKTHPQRMICRLLLGWNNQTCMPVQAYPAHTNFALASVSQVESLSLKQIHAQLQSLLDVMKDCIAPHCFLDAIWHHVNIPFNGYRTYMTLVLDAADPMPDINAILHKLMQFWQHETSRWGGYISVVSAPQPWRFDHSGSGFFIPPHHYCGVGLVHADDAVKRSELYTQLVHFTCASQQVISLLPESDVPLIGIYARNVALQLVSEDVALPGVDADQLVAEVDEN